MKKSQKGFIAGGIEFVIFAALLSVGVAIDQNVNPIKEDVKVAQFTQLDSNLIEVE